MKKITIKSGSSVYYFSRYRIPQEGDFYVNGGGAIMKRSMKEHSSLPQTVRMILKPVIPKVVK